MDGTTMRAKQKQWQALFPVKLASALDFPDFVLFDGPYAEPAPDALVSNVRTMLDRIRLALRFGGEHHDAGILVVYCAAAEAPVYALDGHSLHFKRNEFEAEF